MLFLKQAAVYALGRGRTSTQEEPLPMGRGSDGQLQLRQIPLVHIVVPDKLIRPGKLLLTVWPSAVEGFLTCFTCMCPGVGLKVV